MAKTCSTDSSRYFATKFSHNQDILQLRAGAQCRLSCNVFFQEGEGNGAVIILFPLSVRAMGCYFISAVCEVKVVQKQQWPTTREGKAKIRQKNEICLQTNHARQRPSSRYILYFNYYFTTNTVAHFFLHPLLVRRNIVKEESEGVIFFR